MTLLGFIAPFQLLLILFIIGFVILFPLMALISALKNDFPGNDKVIWVLLIIFLPFLGALLYFLIGRPKRIKHSQRN